MLNKSLATCARQIAGSVALCSFAIAAQADPISLTGVCHLSSIIAGQGRCDLTYQLSDDFIAPSTAFKSYVKIDGVIVAQFVNDYDNPIDFPVPYVSGTANVACGVTHTVTAWVRAVEDPATFVQKGNLPKVLCPTAP